MIEGPSIVRFGGYFYMLYSGGLFGGTVGCDYAVGTARSRTLMGDWREVPGQPDPQGRQRLALPRPRLDLPGRQRQPRRALPRLPEGAGRLAGRQMLAGAALLRRRRLAADR